jgi:hypothetical protein
MNKDFSYQYYPGDCLRDIQFFNESQKSCYLTVLNCHIENISFSYEFLMKITKVLSEEERAEFIEIFSTEIIEEKTFYFISWVKESILKRSKYLISRANNKKGKVKEIEKSYENHMEYKNKNKNKDISKNKVEKIKNEIPDILEFINYTEEQFFKSGLNQKYNFAEIEPQVRLKYSAWVENKWHDGNGVKIKNWKSKATNQIKYYTPNGNKEKLTTIEKQRDSYAKLDKLFDAQLSKSNINFSGGIPPQ